MGGWPGVLVHLLDRSDGPSEPPSLHEAGPEQQQGGNSNAADSSSAARGLPGVPPLSPYRVRHFRSGREGVAIETNIAGDRLHIFFADRASYEWRWTSAFPRQEALQGQPPQGQLPTGPPSATPGTGTDVHDLESIFSFDSCPAFTALVQAPDMSSQPSGSVHTPKESVKRWQPASSVPGPKGPQAKRNKK